MKARTSKWTSSSGRTSPPPRPRMTSPTRSPTWTWRTSPSPRWNRSASTSSKRSPPPSPTASSPSVWHTPRRSPCTSRRPRSRTTSATYGSSPAATSSSNEAGNTVASNTAGWRVANGLGSNMPGDQGSPEAVIRAAARPVLDLPATELLAAYQVYATPPWGVVTQYEFRNAVLLVATDLEPLDLLHACQNIENEGGRVRLQHWGPRTVDLDLLAAYDA